MMTQLLGTAFLGLAAMNWTVRNIHVLEDARPIFLGNFVMNVIGFVVALMHKLDGLGNNWSWIPIILYLFFALAFGYCLLDRRYRGVRS
ncbi:MAG: hypothetical protein GY796_08105 [Chloroflexi bacterium]|nr:hypothetical protein [Chloroflexota bacterium]